MYKYILQEAGNLNWMALFALITFFVIFSISIYLAFMKDEASLKEVSELPLSDNEIIK